MNQSWRETVNRREELNKYAKFLRTADQIQRVREAEYHALRQATSPEDYSNRLSIAVRTILRGPGSAMPAMQQPQQQPTLPNQATMVGQRLQPQPRQQQTTMIHNLSQASLPSPRQKIITPNRSTPQIRPAGRALTDDNNLGGIPPSNVAQTPLQSTRQVINRTHSASKISQNQSPKTPVAPVGSLVKTTSASRLSRQMITNRQSTSVRIDNKSYVPKMKELMGTLHDMSFHFNQVSVDQWMHKLFSVATAADNDPFKIEPLPPNPTRVANMIEEGKRINLKLKTTFDERFLLQYLSEFATQNTGQKMRTIQPMASSLLMKYPSATQLEALVQQQQQSNGIS